MKTKASPKDLYKQIEAAVVAGKLTEEEAAAKMSAIKKAKLDGKWTGSGNTSPSSPFGKAVSCTADCVK